MAVEAGELGFDSMVAIGQESIKVGDFLVIGGILVRELQIKPIIQAARNNMNNQAVLIVNAGDNGFNRSVLQIRGVHIVRHLHKTEKNSFDHITSRMAAEYSIAIDLDIRPLVMARGGMRQKIIQRYRDILRLQGRFEFPLTISSNARNPAELKSVREIVNLLTMAGMEETDVVDALKTPGRLLSPKGPVSVVR